MREYHGWLVRTNLEGVTTIYMPEGKELRMPSAPLVAAVADAIRLRRKEKIDDATDEEILGI